MDESVPQNTFEGFCSPDDGFTRIPNGFFEKVLGQIDNLAELKIVLYVMRHTWGFQEYAEFKKITTDEFAHGRKRKDGTRMDDGTGLGLTATKDGIKRAVAHGYLVASKDARDKGRIKKYYWLRMQGYKVS